MTSKLVLLDTFFAAQYPTFGFIPSGSRRKTCCGRLGVCACRRPVSGIASTPDSYGGNFSSGIVSFYSFNKCRGDSCKLKCRDNSLILPLNNFKCTVNNKHFVINTDENLDCTSCNIIYSRARLKLQRL